MDGTMKAPRGEHSKQKPELRSTINQSEANQLATLGPREAQVPAPRAPTSSRPKIATTRLRVTPAEQQVSAGGAWDGPQRTTVQHPARKLEAIVAHKPTRNTQIPRSWSLLHKEATTKVGEMARNKEHHATAT